MPVSPVLSPRLPLLTTRHSGQNRESVDDDSSRTISLTEVDLSGSPNQSPRRPHLIAEPHPPSLCDGKGPDKALKILGLSEYELENHKAFRVLGVRCTPSDDPFANQQFTLQDYKFAGERKTVAGPSHGGRWPSHRLHTAPLQERPKNDSRAVRRCRTADSKAFRVLGISEQVVRRSKALDVLGTTDHDFSTSQDMTQALSRLSVH